MKKILVAIAGVLFAFNANAFDLAEVAGKVKSAADEANEKIAELKSENAEKKEEAKSSIMEKIAELKEKIAEWQSSDDAESSETLNAIKEAKESIEKLTAQLKALQ